MGIQLHVRKGSLCEFPVGRVDGRTSRREVARQCLVVWHGWTELNIGVRVGAGVCSCVASLNHRHGQHKVALKLGHEVHLEEAGREGDEEYKDE